MTKATANIFTLNVLTEPCVAPIELVCSVNSLASLKAAVDNGANCVRLEYRAIGHMHGFSTNRCNFRGMAEGIRYAHRKNCKATLELDIDAHPSLWECLRDVVDLAAKAGVDAVLLSDPSLTLYTTSRHPAVRVHYASREADLHSGAINLLHRRFGVSRIVLPRVVSLLQARSLARRTSVELELVGFGLQSAIVEPRRITFRCSSEDADLIGSCAWSESASNDSYYAMERTPATRALELLPQLVALGVHAINIDSPEGGAIGIARTTRIWREAINQCLSDPDHYSVKPSWITELSNMRKVTSRFERI
jgi:collagenase-like PrtC family protease